MTISRILSLLEVAYQLVWHGQHCIGKSTYLMYVLVYY